MGSLKARSPDEKGERLAGSSEVYGVGLMGEAGVRNLRRKRLCAQVAPGRREAKDSEMWCLERAARTYPAWFSFQGVFGVERHVLN